MNESAGEQGTDVFNDAILGVTDAFEATDYQDEPAPTGSRREGLPQGFRMRHDAHYVEELMSGARERPGGFERRDTPLREAPPREAHVRDTPREPAADAPAAPDVPQPAGPVFDLIASRLEAVVAHSGISPAGAAGFVTRSIQAELARVSRLARAAALLHQPAIGETDEVLAHDIATASRAVCGTAVRPSGLACEVAVDDPAFVLAGNRETILQAIAGTVDALVDLLLGDPAAQRALDRDRSPRIAIDLQCVKIRPALIVKIACPLLRVTDRQAERFFGNHEDDYRNAPAAGVLLAAAARGVLAHGGRADVERQPQGLTVTYVFPSGNRAIG